MLNWLRRLFFKPKPELLGFNAEVLRKITADIPKKDGPLTQQQLLHFYNKTFIPAATRRAEQGFSSIDVYDLMITKMYWSLDRFNQVKNYLEKHGFKNLESFKFYW